jgi:hypothetical protein
MVIPEQYKLHQNYPNPFNPVTKIGFDIPKTGFVNIVVYNLLGKEVGTIVNQQLNAGSYSVDFNGEKLSSGTYFYRLQSGDFTDTKRMLMIK